MARPFLRFHPHTLTAFAFVAAISASMFLYIGNFYLLFGSASILINALFDALDGKVAEMSGMASLRGDFLDHVLDRYADVFLLGAITIGPYCDPTIGLLGILGVLLASYMGTQAQALTGRRDYSGVLGRADRLVILFFAPIIQFITLRYSATLYGFTAFEIIMIWFALAGHITAVHRGINTWRALNTSCSRKKDI